MPSDSTPDSDALFAANLRLLREEARISQEELASRMTDRGWRFHQTTVNKIENGERKVSIGEADGLARALHVRLESLLIRSDTMEYRAHRINRAVQDVSAATRQLNEPLTVITKDLRSIAEEAEKLRKETVFDEGLPSKLDTIDAFAGWSTPELLLQEIESLQARGISGFVKRLRPDVKPTDVAGLDDLPPGIGKQKRA